MNGYELLNVIITKIKPGTSWSTPHLFRHYITLSLQYFIKSFAIDIDIDCNNFIDTAKHNS